MSQSICFGLHYLNHNDVRSLFLYSVFLISPHIYTTQSGLIFSWCLNCVLVTQFLLAFSEAVYLDAPPGNFFLLLFF